MLYFVFSLLLQRLSYKGFLIGFLFLQITQEKVNIQGYNLDLSKNRKILLMLAISTHFPKLTSSQTVNTIRLK